MNPNVILVFSAHAADFCSRAGGILAKYVRKGDKVHVTDLTYGERGESSAHWAINRDGCIEDAKRQREKEAKRAAKILGVSIDFLDFDDYPLIIDRSRIQILAQRIQDIRPSIVLTHWGYDSFNPDHAETSKAVIRAISCATKLGFAPNTEPIALPEVFFFEPSIPITEFNQFSADLYINITDTFKAKSEALECFTSQPFLQEWYTRYALQRAHQARTWSGKEIKFAEGFKRYTPYVGELLPIIEWKERDDLQEDGK